MYNIKNIKGFDVESQVTLLHLRGRPFSDIMQKDILYKQVSCCKYCK